ncbi:MAG: hypothetical protein R2712_03830 [Vicinamibacterales bacterium]
MLPEAVPATLDGRTEAIDPMAFSFISSPAQVAQVSAYWTGWAAFSRDGRDRTRPRR